MPLNDDPTRVEDAHTRLTQRQPTGTFRADEWFRRFPNGGTVFARPDGGDGGENGDK